MAMLKNNSVKVAWSEVPGSTGYDLEVDGSLVSDITGTSYIHNGLSPKTQHTYKVRAKTTSETGNWSKLITVSTLPVMPQTPTNINSSSTTTSVTITWDSVSNATGYDIEADGVLIDKGDGTSYLHSSLLPDTQHTYRVRSKNISGTSEWSQPITVSTKSSTSTYTINCETNDIFSLMFTASDVDDPSKYTFTVAYNPDELEVLDLCGTTQRTDLNMGNIMGSDVSVTQFTPGTIVFTKTGGVDQGQTWSGMVNSIKFKAKTAGQPSVIYSIQ